MPTQRLALPLLAWVSLVLTASVTASAGEYNPVLSIGDTAPAWKNLPGVDGKKHSLADLKDKQAIVLVFTCNSCPYAVDYEARIMAFAKKHAGPKNQVALVAVNVNKVEEDLLPAMKKRAKAKGFNFPYLYDETQQIGKAYGAGYTPEFFVLDSKRKIVYMGAMDDATDPTKVKVNYVTTAVTAALAGKAPKTTETVPIGCRVRYERRRRKKP
jgi:peroxiredoxin